MTSAQLYADCAMALVAKEEEYSELLKDMRELLSGLRPDGFGGEYASFRMGRVQELRKRYGVE